MKKWIAGILAMLMLLLSLAACGEEKDPSGDGENKDPQKQEAVIKTFGGEAYNILAKEDTDYEFIGDLATGDRVKISVYERNAAVEQQNQVQIFTTTRKGGWGERQDFAAAVRAEKFGGGTDGYDLIATHSVSLGWMGIEGLGKDMAQYDDIDFSNVWWNQNLYDSLNLNGHIFMMIGDIGYTLYEYMQVMFVNETQFENYYSADGGVKELYRLVDDGEWTWAKLWEYAEGYGSGADGDGKYGIIANMHSWRASFVSQEASLYERDAKGKLSLPNALGRKESNIIQEMITEYNKDNMYLYIGGFDTGSAQLNPVFLANNLLFYPQTLNEAKVLFADASEEVGLVPLPKYDTMQEMYKTQCRDTVTGVMIMCTTKNEEKAAAVTEALCKASHEYVVPEYYEVSLCNRYLDRFTDLLDEIRAGLTNQPWECYLQNSAGDSCTVRWDGYYSCILNNGATQADTKYAGSVSKGQNELTTFYNKLAKMGITY